MLERFLGQTWVLVASLVLAPTILYWMHRRRKRLAEGAGRPAGTEKRPAPAAKAATPTATPAAPEPPTARKPLWPGYRGIKWGQPPPEGMKVLHEEGETRFLARPSDELRIGNVHISSVAYSFRLDQLEAVVIDLPLGGFELLARHLTAEWGSPRSSADRGKLVWADPGSGPDASQAVLEKRVESRSARLVLSSRAAQAGRAAARGGS